MRSMGQETRESSVSGPDSASVAPFRVRLPGFVINEEIGLGDAVKRFTRAFGITPCMSCEKRASTLNSRVVLSALPRRRGGA